MISLRYHASLFHEEKEKKLERNEREKIGPWKYVNTGGDRLDRHFLRGTLERLWGGA